MWSVQAFFERRLSEIDECGVELLDIGQPAFAVEEGSNELRGRTWLHVGFGEPGAYLQAHETVRMLSATRATRERYSYYLVIGGVGIWGYDRDPLHDPAEHWHLEDDHDNRRDCPVVSFKQAVHMGWAELAARKAGHAPQRPPHDAL